jgi:hypothetical protein
MQKFLIPVNAIIVFAILISSATVQAQSKKPAPNSMSIKKDFKKIAKEPILFPFDKFQRTWGQDGFFKFKMVEYWKGTRLYLIVTALKSDNENDILGDPFFLGAASIPQEALPQKKLLQEQGWSLGKHVIERIIKESEDFKNVELRPIIVDGRILTFSISIDGGRLLAFLDPSPPALH